MNPVVKKKKKRKTGFGVLPRGTCRICYQLNCTGHNVIGFRRD